MRSRAALDVIHRDFPEQSAIRPSMVVPSFNVTSGRLRVIHQLKGAINAKDSSRQTPSTTSIPARRKRRSPLPA